MFTLSCDVCGLPVKSGTQIDEPFPRLHVQLSQRASTRGVHLCVVCMGGSVAGLFGKLLEKEGDD